MAMPKGNIYFVNFRSNNSINSAQVLGVARGGRPSGFSRKTIDDLRKARGLHTVTAFGHGPVNIGLMPAGVAQSRHAFVGGTVSTWGK